MKRIFLFLSSFIILIGVVAVVLALTTGKPQMLRDLIRPASDMPTENMGAVTPVDSDALMIAARAAFLGDADTPPDDAAGAALIRQAADAGNERAIGFLGTLYMGGVGVEQDMTKAREWLSKSQDAEAQSLAHGLMAFEAVLQTLPPEESAKAREMSLSEARAGIRDSLIVALQNYRTAEELQAAQNALNTTDHAGSDTAAQTTDTTATTGE